MIELRCPACSRANAVADYVSMDRVRCAACSSGLESGLRIRYRVAGPGRGWGAQVHSDLVFRASGGSLGRRMILSEEGGPWFRAGERADLFESAPRREQGPAAAVRQRKEQPRPARSRRTGRVAVPSSVVTMASLCKLLGVLLLLLAVGGFFLASSFNATGAGMVFFLVLLAIGWGQIAIAGGLLRGSAGARAIQLGFAVVAVVFYVYGLGSGADGTFLLLGGLFVATPFCLLLTTEARAWFDP